MQRPRARQPRPTPKKPTRDRLASPWLFDIALGQDSPEEAAKKIGVELSASKCEHKAPEPPQEGKSKSKGHAQKAAAAPKQAADPRESSYCWKEPGLRDVKLLTIDGYDTGKGAVASEIVLWHAPSAWEWVKKALVSDLGDPDETDTLSMKWSWGHSEVALHYADCARWNDPSSCSEIALDLTHWPTLRQALAHRPVVPGEAQSVSPWRLDFGHDSADTAQAKLQAAGFQVQPFGCMNMYENARSFRVRSCRFQGGPLRGLQDATLEVIADRSTVLAYELSYDFNLDVWSDITRQLSEQYGSPEPREDTTALQWWLGAVGVEVMRTDSFFRVSYYHGRLRQLSYKAMRESQEAERSIQKQGL